MLVQKMVVLRDIPVVEIGNAKIKDDVEKEGEIENNKIKTITLGSDYILNVPVNSENKNRLDKKIE